jgi:acyl-CoA thioester hydrolase
MARHGRGLFTDRCARAGLRVASIGRSSVRYEVGIFAEGDNACAALGTFVHVFVCRPENTPVPIPDGLRAAMGKLLVQKPGAPSPSQSQPRASL